MRCSAHGGNPRLFDLIIYAELSLAVPLILTKGWNPEYWYNHLSFVFVFVAIAAAAAIVQYPKT